MTTVDDHMTIDLFIAFLLRQKEHLGGNAPVAVMWDCMLSDIGPYGVHNGVLVLSCQDYASSELNAGFEYMDFEYDDDARPQRQQEKCK